MKTKLEKYAEKYDLIACYEQSTDIILIYETDIFDFAEPITNRLFRLLADINEQATNNKTLYVAYSCVNDENNERFIVICSCSDLYENNL